MSQFNWGMTLYFTKGEKTRCPSRVHRAHARGVRLVCVRLSRLLWRAPDWDITPATAACRAILPYLSNLVVRFEVTYVVCMR